MSKAEKFRRRCRWAGEDPVMIRYHDEEWGVPVSDDRRLFEFLILEGAQAGLSWQTVLHKRFNYRRAFDGFDARKIARYDKADVRRLLRNPGIIRNRLKVQAAIINARQFLQVQQEFGSFRKYLWKFSGGKPIQHRLMPNRRIPSTSRESDSMSRDLRRRGFKFVGSTICYAFMQAVGMVNDHTTDCFRYKPVSKGQT